MACPDSDGSKKDEELHFGFIDFLFSLSVAQVAVKFAELVSDAEKLDLSFLDARFFPAYSHLALALILITTSWIGWNKSKSSHRGTVFGSVWSLDFCELIIDVLLVIIYYVLVEHTDSISSGTISARPEILCITAVFSLYFLWDLISKWPWRTDKDGRHLGKHRLRERILPSVICLSFAILIAVTPLPAPESTHQVILMDISLVGLIILFRDLKEWSCGRSWNPIKHWRVVASFLVFTLPLLVLAILFLW